jgi:DNA-nicking Smr family endonuclease
MTPDDGDDNGDDGAGDAGDDVTQVPITDELDLHHFAPREVADLVTEYLHAAHAEGLRTVRVIHGKGTGALRRTVHAALDRHPLVASYALADDRSSWGATIVQLVDAAAPSAST